MTQKTPQDLLEGAYDLKNAADNIAYYKDFAAHYDKSFADGLGYNSPHALAEFFKTFSTDVDLPIADIGCGTGLFAEALNDPTQKIDGYDISPEMLEIARNKNLYRDLYCADLTQSLAAYPQDYGAIVSSGTFTLGHLGPGDLTHIMGLLRPSGLVCITVSVRHYETEGFESFLNDLQNDDHITKPHIKTIPIYTKTSHEHSSDMAHMITFRKKV